MTFQRERGARGEVRFTQGAPGTASRSHPLRAARMLAVAHALAGMLAREGAPTRDELARALGMTKARVSQLLDLTLLAPDIQEELVFMEMAPGPDPVPERALRHVVRALAWSEQRRRWEALCAHGGRGTRLQPWAGRPQATKGES